MQRNWRLATRTALVSAVILTALSVVPHRPVAAATGDIGFRGPSTAGISGSAPTGAKPESKLWWNDGSWWAAMWSTEANANRIFRLDAVTWSDTGTTLDSRAGSRADVLWDGSRLYVASHIFSNSSGVGYPSRLYRYSYDPGTRSYSLDAAFPVAINNYKTETLVIDKDSTGKLWATWTQGGEVYINATQGDDAVWGTPFRLPVAGATGLASDDISSVVAFAGARVGVMWSSQTDGAMYFAEHLDSEVDTAWKASRTAIQGPGTADDHINLKVVQADSSGRVYAAVKTSHTSSTAPLVMLLVRDPAAEDWASYVYGRVSDHHTRPILVIDEASHMIHMFATAGEAGGTIYKKSSPIDNIAFPSGKGIPVIRDAASADMNDATSTKQTVNAATGIVVLASNDTTDYYWHHYSSLVLAADFSSSTTEGLGPLSVQFTDTSDGAPTSWNWDFGDGTTSTEQAPTHTYTASGSYDVSLTVTDAGGATSTKVKTGYVRILPSAVSRVTADAHVGSDKPSSNFGATTSLKLKYSSSKTNYRAYVSFDVSGVTTSVTAAKLRLYVTNSSVQGGTVHVVTAPWGESTITWANAPGMSAEASGTLGSVTAGTWVDVTLPASLFSSGNGTYRFAIKNATSDDVGFSSREGGSAAELVLGI